MNLLLLNAHELSQRPVAQGVQRKIFNFKKVSKNLLDDQELTPFEKLIFALDAVRHTTVRQFIRIFSHNNYNNYHQINKEH